MDSINYRALFVVGAIIIGFAFYWFQWRPTQIRKECSWSERHVDAVQALTQSQIDQNVANYKNCIATKSKDSSFGAFLLRSTCGQDESYWEPQAYAPARSYYQPASPSEYNSCLHQHGM